MLPPRLDPEEIDYFKSLLGGMRPGTQMVEWGSGGSTTMFLPYFREGKLISIEHNEEWYNKVHTDIDGSDEYPRECRNNFVYILAKPRYLGQDVNKAFYGYGVPFEENPCFCNGYINPGDSGAYNSDIFFVDGICRGAILATIQAKATNRSAHVYIHDYYGEEKREEWYRWASNLYRHIEPVGTTLARLYL